MCLSRLVWVTHVCYLPCPLCAWSVCVSAEDQPQRGLSELLIIVFVPRLRIPGARADLPQGVEIESELGKGESQGSSVAWPSQRGCVGTLCPVSPFRPAFCSGPPHLLPIYPPLPHSVMARASGVSPLQPEPTPGARPHLLLLFCVTNCS